MPPVLIVAYGNPLRSDDGVARLAAEALEDKFSPRDVEIVRLHQLAPEVADDIQNRELVLFIDAACVDSAEGGRTGEIRVHEVSRKEIDERPHEHFTHTYSPARVLCLARELYGAAPRACVITVAGENFGHGERLSSPVAEALPQLLVRIEQLVESSIPKSETTKDTK